MRKVFRLKKQEYKISSYKLNRVMKNISAFTMVEIIVTLAILSTSMLAVFGVLSQCSTADSQSMMLTKSVLLAENLLSETMLKRTLTYQTTQGSEGRFSWQVQIAPTEIDNLAAVCVQVSWLQQQRQQQYELFSLVCVPSNFEGN